MSLIDNGAGYLKTNISVCGGARQVVIHRLVAEHFLGERPEGYFVCHKDGNSKNNRADNLYYGTPSQNTLDYLETTKCRRKLSDDDVREIRRRARAGEPQKQIASDFGIAAQTVSQIKNGSMYGWIQEKGIMRDKEGYRLKLEELKAVKPETHWTQKEVSVLTGLDPRTVKKWYGIGRSGVDVTELARRLLT